MTDNEIITALECCMGKYPCEECPYDDKKCSNLEQDALDLINRQKAEIERLQEKIKRLKAIATNFGLSYTQAKSEAYKELVPLLIDKAENGVIHTSDISDFVVELVKENEGK